MNGDNTRVDPGSSFTKAIEAVLAEIDGRDLRGPASALSQRYRSGGGGSSHDPRSEQLQAYLATRAPATFAAARRVLNELASLRPDWIPETVCDLGAGPATATFATAEVFGPVARAVLVERDQKMAALGARLLEKADPRPAEDLEWSHSDVTAAPVSASDLVIASYVLGELGRDVQSRAVKNWYSATRGALVILEPGTPAGFERLRTARTELISVGAHVTAPCPHEDACPMEGSNWCHFAVRLERSVLHRELKRATLSYEDEKYAYLAVSPKRTRTATSRLLRSPRLHKGHVRIVTCEAGGLVEGVVSRRDGDAYKRARRARWGDRLDPE